MINTTSTQKEAVFNYLRKNRRYIPGPEIEIIGDLRRLRELRNEGNKIPKRRNPKTGIWEYRLTKMTTVYKKRGYYVLSTAEAKRIAQNHILSWKINVEFGLPEVDDKPHTWQVPLCVRGHRIGEIVIDAYSGQVKKELSSQEAMLDERIKHIPQQEKVSHAHKEPVLLSTIESSLELGKAEDILPKLEAGSIDLCFTSPPYFDARLQYADYEDYPSYLENVRQVIRATHRVLGEGRFFVMNCAPILIPRASRNESSQRKALPFDMHRLFSEEGFDFIDDIIWEKPAGAGWATGRGRRFAKDRNPLQYKAVPVTEYILVYRKQTDKLIDWHIRNHPNQTLVKESKIEDYDQTNVWKISPAHRKTHPAVFPVELAERVIRYYSFKNDVVLDPYMGSGTTAIAALNLERRYFGIEKEDAYYRDSQERINQWTPPRNK